METRRKATLVKGSNAFIIENNRIVRKVTIVSCAGGLYKIRFDNGAGSCVKGYRLYNSKEDADAALDKERQQYRRFSSPYT